MFFFSKRARGFRVPREEESSSGVCRKLGIIYQLVLLELTSRTNGSSSGEADEVSATRQLTAGGEDLNYSLLAGVTELHYSLILVIMFRYSTCDLKINNIQQKFRRNHHIRLRNKKNL